MSAAAPRRLVVETDGGSRGNPGPAGYGTVVREAGGGAVLAERAGYLGIVSNNVAEYSGLVAGLRTAAQIDPGAQVEVRMDSKLVVEQMSGRWQIKHEDMRRLAREARAAYPPARVTYTWVPRSQNAAADALANEAMDSRAGVARGLPESVTEPVTAPATGSPATPSDGPATEPGTTATAPDAPSSVRAARPSGAAMRFDDAEPVTVVLVRHGETPMTAAKQYSGSSVPGPGLTAAGRTQAAQAADLVDRIGRALWPDLPRVEQVLASPMTRAQETATALGRRLGLQVHTDRAFAEVDFGRWEGLTAAEIDARSPGLLQRWHLDGSAAAPDGESLAMVGERVRARLGALLEHGQGTTVAVVSHAVAIRATIGVTIGAPASHWAGIRIPAASVSIVRWWADGATELVVVGCPSGT